MSTEALSWVALPYFVGMGTAAMILGALLVVALLLLAFVIARTRQPRDPLTLLQAKQGGEGPSDVPSAPFGASMEDVRLSDADAPQGSYVVAPPPAPRADPMEPARPPLAQEPVMHEAAPVESDVHAPPVHAPVRQSAFTHEPDAPRRGDPELESASLAQIAQYLAVCARVAEQDADAIDALRDQVVDVLVRKGWEEGPALGQIGGWRNAHGALVVPPLPAPGAAAPRAFAPQAGLSLYELTPGFRGRPEDRTTRLPADWATLWTYVFARYLDRKWSSDTDPGDRIRAIEASVVYRERLAREGLLWTHADDVEPRVVPGGTADGEQPRSWSLPGLRSVTGSYRLEPVVVRQSPRPRFLSWWRHEGRAMVNEIGGVDEVERLERFAAEVDAASRRMEDAAESARTAAEQLVGLRERVLRAALSGGALTPGRVERTDPLLEQARIFLEGTGVSIPDEHEALDGIHPETVPWPVPRTAIEEVPPRLWLRPPFRSEQAEASAGGSSMLVAQAVKSPFEGLAIQALWWGVASDEDARAMVKDAREIDRAMALLGPGDLLDEDARARIYLDFWPRFHENCFPHIGDADAAKPLRATWLRSVKTVMERVGLALRDAGETTPDNFDSAGVGEHPRPALVDVETEQAMSRGIHGNRR